MNNWFESNIGSLTVYQKAGGTPLVSDSSLYDGDIPFVIIEDITKSSKYLFNTAKSISQKGLLFSSTWIVPEDHILYSMYATVGKPIINKISCATNQAIIALKPSSMIEVEFLYYALLFIKPFIHKYTSQTTQSNLNAKVVKKLKIQYPRNKLVQQEIADILSTIDETIEKTDALIKKYTQIKSGLMHDLFTRGVTPDGKLRQPREKAPALYKETPIGWIPKDWEVLKLGDLIIQLDSGVSVNSLDQPKSAGQIGILKTSCLSGGIFNPMENKIVIDKDRNRVKCKVISNSIIISRMNTFDLVGESAYVNEDYDDLYLPDRLWMTRFSEKYKNYVKWLSQLLQSKNLRSKISNRSTGTSGSMKNISKPSLLGIEIGVPDDIEQGLISNFLNNIFNYILNLETQKNKLIKQKIGLMHDLLTGKIQVTTKGSGNG